MELFSWPCQTSESLENVGKQMALQPATDVSSKGVCCDRLLLERTFALNEKDRVQGLIQRFSSAVSIASWAAPVICPWWALRDLDIYCNTWLE